MEPDGKTPSDKIGGSTNKGPNGSSPNTARFTIAPPREVPKELFVYWPDARYDFDFVDYTLSNADGSARAALELGLLGPFVPVDKVTHSLSCVESAGNRITVYRLKDEFDLAGGALKAGWSELKVAGGTAYQQPKSGNVVCRPKPNIVLFSFNVLGLSKTPNSKLLEELLTRTDADNKTPDGLWALFQELSGHGSFRSRIPKAGDEFVSITAKYRVSVSVGPQQDLTCWEYANPEQAKQAEAEFKTADAKVAEMVKKIDPTKSMRRAEYETGGSRLYRLTRSEKQ